MFEFLSRFFLKEKSKEVAKDRLQLVLIHDRNDIDPEKLEALKSDMIKLLKKYVEIDEKRINVNLERRNRSVALVADIPLKISKRPVRGRKKNG